MQFTFGNWLKYSTVKFMLKNENADKHEIVFRKYRSPKAQSNSKLCS